MITKEVTTEEYRRVVEYITTLYKNKITPQDCDAEHILNICHDSEYTEKIVELAIVLAKNKGTCRIYLIDTLL
jgi:hypothetical protein